MQRLPPSCLTLAFASICLLLDSAIAQQVATDAQWNRFRGPNGTGLAAEGSFTAEIGPEQNVIWKRAFPTGHSSPVFSDELLFLTGVEDEQLFTYAVDRESGKTRWRRQAPRPRRTKFHPKNGPAGASPAVDSDTVAVFFDEYGMLAYDHAGVERWRLPLGPFNNMYGMAASPIIVDDVVVLPCDHGKGSFVIGVAKQTGDVLWNIDRPSAVSGHCTPVVYEPKEGGKQVILPGSFLLDSYDVKTGARVWWIRGLPAEMKSVPVLIGDTLWIHGFATPLNNHGRQLDLPAFEAALKEMDKNGDKLLAADELADRRVKRYFRFSDLDSNGKMDNEEWELIRASFASVNCAMAVRVGGSRDMTDTSVLWHYYRSIPQLPSPLIVGDAYYLLADQGGLMSTISPDKGELLEKGRVGRGGDAHFASPVAGDGKVFVLSEAGILTVLAAGKDLEPLHTADFDDQCYATPALVGGSIWLRTHTQLYRLGKR